MTLDECLGLFESWIEARRAFSAHLDEVMPRSAAPDMLARRSQLEAAMRAAERAYQQCVERKWAERT